MRNKKRRLKLFSLTLLLIYIFGSSPFVLFHHHENEIIAYEAADACQRAVYYGEAEADAHHDSHLSKIVEECPLCDHHTLSQHLQPAFELFLPTEKISHRVLDLETHVEYTFLFHFYTRGPPATA